MNTMIDNPLFSNKINKIKLTNIIKDYKYKYVYILIYTNNNVPINSAIYSCKIDTILYNQLSKNIILEQAPISLLTNEMHLTKVSILEKNILDPFNIYNYNLYENNLVLLMFNISWENIKLYISQYTNINTFENLWKILLLNNYFDVYVYNNKKILIDNTYIKNYIVNLVESNYWTISNNCNLNLSVYFQNRTISISNNIKSNFKNYIFNNFKNNNYIDPSKILLNNYIYIINKNNIFSKDEITTLIINLPPQEKYLLYCNLLISKEYCHLVLNNRILLIHMKPILSKYNHVFRYLIGYAWVRFYIEESIKKTFIVKEDQFIFDIDTASELPIYPFSIKFPKLNPYMPILVSDKILNANNNYGCIDNYNSMYEFIQINKGITTLEQFRKNLNIFCTGNENINLFDNIQWKEDKIALGGSIICACIQKYHPLVNLFNNYDMNERLKRYYNEYYAQSDIDVMFLTENSIDFIKNVKKFYNQIVINICKNNNSAHSNHIKLECIKQAHIFITMDNIENIVFIHNKSKDYILKNINTKEVHLLFNDIITNELEKYKNIFFNSLKEEQIYEYTENYPEYLDFNNMIILLKLYNEQNKNIQYNTSINIHYKYKIKSPYLDYPFELFSVKYSDFFATVNSFHLPCVRGYYNGSNVYLTPSCISAHLTYMNLDYKYFTGADNPVNILNKYRMRGFGTWLNQNEKNICITYSEQTEFWNNLYSINLKNKETIKSILGSLTINHKLYQPRLYNSDSYYESLPIDLTRGYTIFHDIDTYKITTINEYITELNSLFNTSNYQSIQNILMALTTINSEGTIKPLEKWIIEAAWHIIN